MRLSALHPGAEVECDVLGRIFPARVTGKPAGQQVDVEPLVPTGSYRRVRARQIRRILKPAASPSTQLQFLPAQ